MPNDAVLLGSSKVDSQVEPEEMEIKMREDDLNAVYGLLSHSVSADVKSLFIIAGRKAVGRYNSGEKEGRLMTANKGSLKSATLKHNEDKVGSKVVAKVSQFEQIGVGRIGQCVRIENDE